MPDHYWNRDCNDVGFKCYAYYGVEPPFVIITASTLLGRVFMRFCSVSVGICAYSFYSAFMRPDTDVGKPSSQSPFPKMLSGVGVRDL